MLNEGQQLDKREIITYLITIVNALQYANDNGFHHGCLDTSMIFLDNQNDIKVAGFNTPLAQYVIDNIEEAPVFNHPLPATKLQDIAEDIRALGKIWIKMLLPEEFPLKNNNIIELIHKIPSDYQMLLETILVAQRPNLLDNIIEFRSNIYIYIYN